VALGILSLTSSAGVAGCDSRPATEAGQSGLIARALPGRNVPAQLYETDLKAETTFVVRDSATWARLWRRIDTGPAPVVDFSKEMLLGASIGEGFWGRDVSIRVAADRRDSLVAIVHKRFNAPNICAVDGFRSPADVVRVPRDRRPVAFHWEVEELRCNSG
jgi:hypothetical protein